MFESHDRISLQLSKIYYTHPAQRRCLMVDTLSVAARSHRMSLITGRNTKPEISLRRGLHATGLRYRIHVGKLPGKPDIVFGPAKLIVFVNGCFWHGHTCPDGHIPKSNSEFWKEKICKNRIRDARNIRALRQSGWKVVVVWECRLRKNEDVIREVGRVRSRILKRQPERDRA